MRRLFPTFFRLASYICIVILLAIAVLQTADADSSSGRLSLVTAPSPILLNAKPGQSVNATIQIRNTGSQTEHLKTNLLKFSATSDAGAPQLLDRQPGDDYFDWVHFSQPSFTLTPSQAIQEIVTIDVPSTAAFGYYYAVTFSRVNQTTDQPIAVRGSTATLVLLNVESPNAKRDLKLRSFSVDHPWYEFLPVRFQATIQNDGNTHVAPRGNIIITRGSEPGSVVEINDTLGNILPHSSRTFMADWTAGFPVWEPITQDGNVVRKNGAPVQQLTWQLDHADQLRFGRYTAHLVMVYDNGSRDVPLEASVTFWVIPWRLILAALLILSLPAILVYFMMRWRMRRAIRSHTKI
jgi:hypothetical protein